MLPLVGSAGVGGEAAANILLLAALPVLIVVMVMGGRKGSIRIMSGQEPSAYLLSFLHRFHLWPNAAALCSGIICCPACRDGDNK